jgi:DNA-binding MarR family transcriptional regulator
MVNLEGAFFSPGALMEMIVPLAQAIHNGSYGPTALLIITSDEGTVEFLEALAKRHDLSLFISPSPAEPLSEARPIGTLTATEMETLSLVRRKGGAVTSSQMANLAGIESNAAVNRLSGLVRKGYLHRVSRSRTEGDAFVELLSAAEKPPTAMGARAVPTSHGEFSIPEDVREGVLLLAAMHGSQPGEVLLRAWREFMTRHRELLEVDSKEVGRMIREGDTAGLATYASRHVRERAKQAASRTKR